MRISLPTLVFIAALGGVSGASAEAYNTASMQQGLDMLKTEVTQAFSQYQINADPNTLSLSQIAIIVGALNDSSNNDSETKDAIEAAVRGEFNQ